MKNDLIIEDFRYTYSTGRNLIKTYEEKYYDSLREFLNEYEDNSETFYLYRLIPEWEKFIIELSEDLNAIKNNDDKVFYFVRNRIRPDGLPDKEDSQEVKSIIDKLTVTKDEEERVSLYHELAEIWRKEESEEEKEDVENYRFPNWREVENEELEKKDCIKLLNRNIATGFLFIDFLKKRQKEIQIEQPQAEIHQQSKQAYAPKPCFDPELIDRILKDLNTFFDASQHVELKRIIETGSNTDKKLLFKDSGNRLTDYFKRLIEADKVTGCDKKDLINWVVKNFQFTHRKTQKDFIFKTVEKTISGTQNPCRNPIT